jgi:hypothetical protein
MGAAAEGGVNISKPVRAGMSHSGTRIVTKNLLRYFSGAFK